jgi:tetratricopeptide (TPR) repeat protein
MGDLRNLTALLCPSCGSAMGVPDSQGIVQCSYCGTKIILSTTELQKENKNVIRYKELCQVARLAKNWKELLKYASEILEIDPKNVEAWLDKALAAGSVSNYLFPRLDETMGYLQKASELSPNDERIDEIKKVAQEVQFNQYTWHAVEINKSAIQMMNLRSAGHQHAVDWTIEAMTYFILAHRIKPDDPTTLQSIKTMSNNGKLVGIQWGQEVQDILNMIERSKKTLATTNKIKILHDKLNQRQLELAKLEGKKGLFVKMDIEDVQVEIKKLSLEIKQLESR